MTIRDLYAACVGISTLLAAEAIGFYLARPTAGIAALLVTSLAIAAIMSTCHVRAVLRERRPIREKVTRPASSRARRTPVTVRRADQSAHAA
jgi:hypothetical protein